MFTFFASRPYSFREGKFRPLTVQNFQICKYLKLGLELPSVIFHGKWGVPSSQFF